MIEVPGWWLWASSIYFVISIVWSAALIGGLVVVYQKAMPVLTEARMQTKRVTEQARSIASKASNTADIIQAQTQQLLGNADRAGHKVTQQARSVGTALTVLLVAARVMNFVRRMV